MYFKIKTTGLNPNKDTIYLITWLDPKTKEKTSLFLPSFDQERAFLENFLTKAPNKITSFRGRQFDLNFLNKKLEGLSLKAYLPQHRDLFKVQEFFEHFQDFPARTRASWQAYYNKSKPLSYKKEQTYLEEVYLDGSQEAKKALIKACQEEVTWYPKLDQDLKDLEEDFKILWPFRLKSLDLIGDSLVVEGTCKRPDQVNFDEKDSLEIVNSTFTYSLLLNQGRIGKDLAFYTLLPPLRRLGLATIPLDSRVLVLKFGKKYIKEDILQVLKNRLEKLTLL